MAGMAINVLWFLIGLIVLAGVIYLAIWVIESFIWPIPEQVKKGVWVIVLLLALIALISVLVGGGHAPFRWSALGGGPLAAIPFAAARYMQGVLT